MLMLSCIDRVNDFSTEKKLRFKKIRNIPEKPRPRRGPYTTLPFSRRRSLRLLPYNEEVLCPTSDQRDHRNSI